MTENEEPTLESALVTSIAKEDLVELGADLAEVGLDHVLAEGLLRDIPVLGTLVALFRTGSTIRDRIFTAKVIRFLVGLAQIPIDERERFLKEHAQKADKNRLGETLVLLLDRLDDMQKPEALSRLFAGYILGQYDLETFRRLATALDRIPLSALSPLRSFYEVQALGLQSPSLLGEHNGQFVVAGLIDIEFHRTGPTGGPGGRYAKNALGELFLKVLGSG